jgi:hypothetical protein
MESMTLRMAVFFLLQKLVLANRNSSRLCKASGDAASRLVFFAAFGMIRRRANNPMEYL